MYTAGSDGSTKGSGPACKSGDHSVCISASRKCRRAQSLQVTGVTANGTKMVSNLQIAPQVQAVSVAVDSACWLRISGDVVGDESPGQG